MKTQRRTAPKGIPKARQVPPQASRPPTPSMCRETPRQRRQERKRQKKRALNRKTKSARKKGITARPPQKALPRCAMRQTQTTAQALLLQRDAAEEWRRGIGCTFLKETATK